MLKKLILVFLAVTMPSMGAEAAEITLEYRDLTLNANLELAEGQDLAAGVVLILHGMTAHNQMEIIEASQASLQENGYSSLAINLSLDIDNRKGFFDCSWTHTHQADDAVDELAAWVQWLRQKGVKKIVLMGHSRGANQVMIYAVEHDEPEITHVVLLAPNTTLNGKRQYEARFGNNFDDNLARVKSMVEAGRGDELIEKFNFFFCPKTTISASSFYSYYRYDDRFLAFDRYLPRMPRPTLVIVGTDDDLQPNIPEHVAPYVDGERIRLEEIEDSGHFFRDLNIEEAIETAIDFIDSAG
ncbi:MAG: alpha/beta hydrolase [Gammaproteobacteria bacterium]|nr:alpha/beta hydrolase [Gammaproteobacteria bacterium]